VPKKDIKNIEAIFESLNKIGQATNLTMYMHKKNNTPSAFAQKKETRIIIKKINTCYT